MNLFVNDAHEQLFAECRQQLPTYKQKSTEYISALYIITSNSELYSKMKSYFTNAGFDSDEMFKEEDFSRGYLVLAKLAVHLFNDSMTITPLELTSSLDQEGFQLAMNAIYIRRTGAF